MQTTAPAPVTTADPGRAANRTVLIGSLLTAIGPIAFVGSGGASATAFLPSVLGLALVGCGLAARRPERRRTAMHVAAAIGVLGLLGSLRVVGALPDYLDGEGELGTFAVFGQLATAGLCAWHTTVAVGSFRAARRQGQAARPM